MTYSALLGATPISFASADEFQQAVSAAWVNTGLDGTAAIAKMTVDRPTFIQLWRWGFVTMTGTATQVPSKPLCLGYAMSVTGTKFA